MCEQYSKYLYPAHNSLNYVGWNKRDIVAADLKRI